MGGSDADGGGRPGVPDLSREGPFDVHPDRPHSGASPRFLDGGQGCQFRMTSYDEENSGPDFSPAYGVQLHDPSLLEYVGAPESACLLTRSPEYWLHHMGRENTLSAALQLQHDAGLILLKVFQQLITAFNKTSSDVMRVVHDRRPFPTCGPLYDCVGFMAATYYSGDPGTFATGDMQCLHVVQRLLPGRATVSRGGGGAGRSLLFPVY